MPPLNEEIEESKALAIRAVVIGAVSLPFWLSGLHLIAALNHIDFTPVKEAEMLVASLAVLGGVAHWAFKSK